MQQTGILISGNKILAHQPERQVAVYAMTNITAKLV
jgi:hypothetical protein